jgi:multiple sugar transport system permease protein
LKGGFKLKRYIPFLLCLPSLFYLIVFIGYPLVQAFILAFSKPKLGFTLENFINVIFSQGFREAFSNTLIISGIVIPLQLAFALALAIFVNKRFKGYMFLIYIITIPLALSEITAGLMSYSIFSTMGFLNKLLLKINFIKTPIYFFGFTYKFREFIVIILSELWRATPLVFVILLAGLQSIDKEYMEAAEVDGASSWQKFSKITLPLLKPSLLSALLLRTTFAFQVFGNIWILVGRDIPVLAGEAYYWQTEIRNSNIASTYAIVIAIITIIFAFFYIKTLRSSYLES